MTRLGHLFKSALLMRKYCKNWVQVVILYLTGRQMITLYIRPSLVLSLHVPRHPRRFQIFALCRLLEAGWTIQPEPSSRVILKSESGISLRCRLDSGFDLWHVAQIFLDNEYGSEFADKCVIDAGMSNGDSSIYFASRGAKLVIGLEPSPESFALAEQNISLNGMRGKVVPLNQALAAAVGTTELMLSTAAPEASAISPSKQIADQVHFNSRVTVNTITVSEIISRFKLDRVDLLKLDCEGCEYEVIRNLAPSDAALISDIIMEFHDGPRNLEECLSRRGYIVRASGTTMGTVHAWHAQ